MIVNCSITGEPFEITQKDLEYYEKIGVPPPTICPNERVRRRLATQNQMNLYKRTCSHSRQAIISDLSEDKPMPVYNIDHWWSDNWEQHATGRDFDFNRPFFEQFRELMDVSPLPALHRTPSFDENCDYTNDCTQNKDCYLIFDSDFSRDSYYSYSLNYCNNVMDCFRMERSEICYECIDCTNCYGSYFLQNCQNCSNSWFMKNCIGCTNCFGCVNTRNKKYHFLNEQCTQEEYGTKLQALNLTKHSHLKNMRAYFSGHTEKFPNKFMEGAQNEDVIGNYLLNCKNSHECFDSRNQRDCKYIVQGYEDCKDAYDCSIVGDHAELLYECVSSGMNSRNNKFVSRCLAQVSDLMYCYYTHLSSDLFGCIGIKKTKHCILNKKYPEKEYFALKEKIIEHMKKTKEYGEFFPVFISPCCYNESVAQDYFPLTKQEVLDRGWRWKDPEPEDVNVLQTYKIPNDIADVKDDILDGTLVCEKTGKPYKIQKNELFFYRKMRLPIPRLAFNVRHVNRVDLRSGRTIIDRKCDSCGIDLKTVYSKEKVDKVLCAECYARAIT